MPVARWPICIEENANFVLNVTLRDIDKSLRDLTGGGALFQVRLQRDDTTTVVLEADHTDYITNGEDDGTLYIDIPVDEVNSPGVAWEEAEYDLLFYPDSADITDSPERVLQGKAKWVPAVATNATLDALDDYGA